MEKPEHECRQRRVQRDERDQKREPEPLCYLFRQRWPAFHHLSDDPEGGEPDGEEGWQYERDPLTPRTQ